jgi:hypothetical protein
MHAILEVNPFASFIKRNFTNYFGKLFCDKLFLCKVIFLYDNKSNKMVRNNACTIDITTTTRTTTTTTTTRTITTMVKTTIIVIRKIIIFAVLVLLQYQFQWAHA